MDSILVLDTNGNPVKNYYQWDKDKTIIIRGIKTGGLTDVHFCNVDSKNAIVVEPTIDGDSLSAKVPNILLQNPKPIIIYVYCTDIETGSSTIYASRVTVIPRPKPADYIYTETDIKTVEDTVLSILAGLGLISFLSDTDGTVIIDGDGAVIIDGNGATEGVVLYTAQELTEEQKTQVRENIGAAAASDVRKNSVLYTAQELTEEQKTQVRENIGAASIDDSKVGADAWSSENIVDKLCPSFTESGSIVTCEPVEGYPLEVVSRIIPSQGVGEPSTENIRPIGGHYAVELGQVTDGGGITANRDFGKTVYGGTLDWNKGTLTDNMVCMTFTGNENWKGDISSYVYLTLGAYGYVDTNSSRICSHFKHVAISGANQNLGFYITNSTGYNDARVLFRPNLTITLNEWISFLKEQYANGTPVQICFGVSAPTVTQLEPQEFFGLSGTNSFYCDVGDTEVKGRANPGAIIEKLTNAILSLGGNV